MANSQSGLRFCGVWDTPLSPHPTYRRTYTARVIRHYGGLLWSRRGCGGAELLWSCSRGLSMRVRINALESYMQHGYGTRLWPARLSPTGAIQRLRCQILPVSSTRRTRPTSPPASSGARRDRAAKAKIRTDAFSSLSRIANQSRRRVMVTRGAVREIASANALDQTCCAQQRTDWRLSEPHSLVHFA